MRPSQVATALNLCIKAQEPVMLWGSPGVGKSEVVSQVAAANDYDFIDLRLSQLDPVDLRGCPSVDTKKHLTSWNPPDFLPSKGRGIFFLDELTSAAQATQAAAYQLILDRRLGDYKLPDGWVVIGASNRVTHRAIVQPMSSALKNRFTHINFDVNNDDWAHWALTHNISPEVISFIRFRPMLLNEFEVRNQSKEEADRIKRLHDGEAFATPRTWRKLSVIGEQQVPNDLEYELYSGIVGEGAAAEYVGYLKYYRNLPNLDALLMNPRNAPVPEEPAVLYALATGLATKATADNIEHVVQYATRMPPEFQVLLMKDASTRDSAIARTKAWVSWTVDNSHVLF